MEDKVKELEYENKQFEKELKEQYRLLEIAIKRQRWYNNNKASFTKDLTDEYQDAVNKKVDQINFLEQTIESNFIKITNITSDRNYILEKIENRRKYDNEYREKVRSKKVYEKRYQTLKNTCKLFSYDDKTESIRDILHKKYDGILFNESIKTCVIDRDNKHIVEF